MREKPNCHVADFITYVDDYINPITGEKGTLEVAVHTPKEQEIDIQEKLGIDTKAMLEAAAYRELEHWKLTKTYDIIRAYASSENKLEHPVIKSDNQMIDNIWKPMIDVIMSSDEPNAVFDVGFACFMTPEFNNMAGEDYEHDDVTLTIYPLKQAEFWDNGKMKKLNISVYAYAPFDERYVLVYDEKNPKNCKFLMYDIDEECYEKIHELREPADERVEPDNEE